MGGCHFDLINKVTRANYWNGWRFALVIAVLLAGVIVYGQFRRSVTDTEAKEVATRLV